MTKAKKERAASSRRLRFTGSSRDKGVRLDRFLANAAPELSRNRLKQLIEAGQLSTSGRTITARGWTDPDSRYALGRVLTAADCEKMMTVSFEWDDGRGPDQSPASHDVFTNSWTFEADMFCRLPDIVLSGNNLETRTLSYYTRRLGDQSLGGFAEMAVHFARNRASATSDELILGIGVPNNTAGDLDNVKMRISLR